MVQPLAYRLLVVVIVAIAALRADKLWASELPLSKRPVDLLAIADDGLMLVVCEQSGEVIAIDTDNGRILDAAWVAKRPLGIETMADGTVWVVASDPGELIEIVVEKQRIRTGERIKTVRHAHALAPAGQRRMLVAGLWSRRVAMVQPATDAEQAKTLWTQSLNFSPRTMRLFHQEQIVLVADAFGSQIAYLDARSGKALRQTEFYGHNLHGFIDDNDSQRLIVSHQMLNSAAQTTNDNIHWGMMLSNDLRWLDRQRVLDGDGELFYKDGHIDPIGVVGHGAADPNDVVCTRDGTVIVALGGTNQLAIGEKEFYELSRVDVGINPFAIALTQNDSMAWVANRLDDSLSQVDIKARRVVRTVRLSKRNDATGAQSKTSVAQKKTPGEQKMSDAQRGERLFHDASLSHDGWMSCASCHPQGHAINELADNLSDGKYQSPKRVLSLRGRFDTAPFGWIGQDADLASQLQRSVHTTMRGSRRLTDSQLTQLTAYLATLPAPPALIDRDNPGVAKSIVRGKAIFERASCQDCHQGDKFTSTQLFDVGMEDEVGNRNFNPPSLLGVGQRGPRYFHNMQAESLREVFSSFQHGLDTPLQGRDLTDLLNYLKSL